MKSLKLIAAAVIAIGVAGPAYAGRDEVQIKQQEKAVKNLRAEQAKGLAGATGPQGQVGPTTKRALLAVNIGHPTERVRR
ncbi:MAG TPA: hypothetical protein VIV54_15100 [Burkholderiales bacterium]